jgi:glutamate racemase
VKRALIFDSGVGGLSVVRALRAAGADLIVDYLADTAWLPYGERPDEALRVRIPALLAALSAVAAPDIVVLACNTASTLALAETRAVLPVPVVGVVPAVKPAAAASRTGVIGLLATPATVGRAYTDRLIAEHAANMVVLRAGSADLVRCAEEALAGAAPDPGRIRKALEPLLDHPKGAAMDVLVLACTHFPLLRDALSQACPGVALIDSSEAVARRVIAVARPSSASSGLRLGDAFLTQAGTAEAVFRGEGFRAARAVLPDHPFTVEPLQGV